MTLHRLHRMQRFSTPFYNPLSILSLSFNTEFTVTRA
jgi:hypothetical protein